MNTLVIIAIVSLIAIGFYCLIITRNIIKILAVSTNPDIAPMNNSTME